MTYSEDMVGRLVVEIEHVMQHFQIAYGAQWWLINATGETLYKCTYVSACSQQLPVELTEKAN